MPKATHKRSAKASATTNSLETSRPRRRAPARINDDGLLNNTENRQSATRRAALPAHSDIPVPDDGLTERERRLERSLADANALMKEMKTFMASMKQSMAGAEHQPAVPATLPTAAQQPPTAENQRSLAGSVADPPFPWPNIDAAIGQPGEAVRDLFAHLPRNTADRVSSFTSSSLPIHSHVPD